MKLSVKKNIEPLREKALATSERFFKGLRDDLTSGYGLEDEVYKIKYEEAQNVENDAKLGMYPMLVASANARGISVALEAKQVIQKREQYVSSLAIIEGHRLTAAMRIKSDKDEATLRHTVLELFGIVDDL